MSVQSHFALSQLDLMGKIGEEVVIVRNKEKFGQVIQQVAQILPDLQQQCDDVEWDYSSGQGTPSEFLLALIEGASDIISLEEVWLEEEDISKLHILIADAPNDFDGRQYIRPSECCF